MRIWATDAPFAHTNCDEQQETWLTDEERAEKAERIKAYERKKYSATVESVLEQINNFHAQFERKS
ncbi:MAG: hypothetical protein ACXWQO_07955 [Bdellovibrionota bacterium]